MERWRLLVVTRPGYGARPPAPRADIEQDAREVAAILDAEGGGHVVGYSYGGSVALAAAARRPDLVRSLTVVEPPAFAVARGDPAVETLIPAARHAYEPERPLTTEEFLRRFMAALGQDLPEDLALPPEERKGVEAMRVEPAPWAISIPLDALAATPFPKLVVSGAWHPAFDAVANVLTERLGAERAVLPGNQHYILDLGEPFNAVLETFLHETDAGRDDSAVARN
jgi:pimeloyl-ACP methyl ester carboxylesterase